MPIVGTHYTLTLDGGDPIEVLEVELHAPPVEYLRSLHAVLPDSTWLHVDTSGHEHRWARTGRAALGAADALPTLTSSTEHVACDGSCGTPPAPVVPSAPEPAPDDDLVARLDWLIAAPGTEGDVSDLDDDCEGYDITVWHCATCGERVKPGTIPDHEAQNPGIPVQMGPPTATLVIDRDPRGDDRSFRFMDAVLRAPDGSEMRGKANVGHWERRGYPDRVETRVHVEMAILDEPAQAGLGDR